MNERESVQAILVRLDGPSGPERQARLAPQYPSQGFQTFALQLWTTSQDFVACGVVTSLRFVNRRFSHPDSLCHALD
jgi:hypothetical protein